MKPSITSAPALLDASLAQAPEGLAPLWYRQHCLGAVSPGWLPRLDARIFNVETRDGQPHVRLVRVEPTLLQSWAQEMQARGALPGWRGEAIEVFGPDEQEPLFHIERSLLRPLGLLLRTVQVNVYTVHQGQPQLWCARRAAHKAIDPGLLASLVAGGIGCDETPLSTLFREAAEEAGLSQALARHALPTGIMDSTSLSEDDGHTVLHRERMHVFDLQVPEGFQPTHPDGETESASLHPLEAVLAQIRQGQWTREGAWASINLMHRHQKGMLRSPRVKPVKRGHVSTVIHTTLPVGVAYERYPTADERS